MKRTNEMWCCSVVRSGLGVLRNRDGREGVFDSALRLCPASIPDLAVVAEQSDRHVRYGDLRFFLATILVMELWPLGSAEARKTRWWVTWGAAERALELGREVCVKIYFWICDASCCALTPFQPACVDWARLWLGTIFSLVMFTFKYVKKHMMQSCNSKS